MATKSRYSDYTNWYDNAVEEINKNEDVDKILSTFKFLVTDAKEDPKFSENPKKNKKYLLNDIHTIIMNYLNYSNKT